MSEKEQQGFSEYAIVEIMGHQRIAGRVTEQVIGGCSFVRVDVPDLPDKGRQGFTKLFGQSAIYAITFVDEGIARRAAESFRSEPVDPYTMDDVRRDVVRQLEHQNERAGQAEDFNDTTDDDDDGFLI